MRARAWCAAGLWGLAASATSCRDITVCADLRLCNASGGVAAGAGSYGPTMAGKAGMGGQLAQGGRPPTGGAPPIDLAGGAAGAAGGLESELVCSPPLADCNQTPLDGCEIDLFSDPEHCGDCNSPCDGVCARGRCHLPVSTGTVQQQVVADFAVIGEALYFTWGPYDGPFHLSRVERAGENARELAGGLPRFSRLAAAPQELFLWGVSETLRVSDLNGVMVDQGFEVSGVASLSGATYAGSKGQLLERPAGATSWEASAWFPSEAGTTLWPIAVDDRLVVFRILEDDRAPRYEVLLASDPSAGDGGIRLLASGDGLPTRIRALHDVYWMVQLPNADSRAFELRRHSLDPDATGQLVASERNVTNFALDESFAYVTRTLNSSYELVLVPVSSISQKYRFGSRIELFHPESVAGLLWFYDSSAKRVHSVDLGLDEFL